MHLVRLPWVAHERIERADDAELVRERDRRPQIPEAIRHPDPRGPDGFLGSDLAEELLQRIAVGGRRSEQVRRLEHRITCLELLHGELELRECRPARSAVAKVADRCIVRPHGRRDRRLAMGQHPRCDECESTLRSSRGPLGEGARLHRAREERRELEERELLEITVPLHAVGKVDGADADGGHEVRRLSRNGGMRRVPADATSSSRLVQRRIP